MSIDATRWAYAQQTGSPSKKLILLAMADRAGEDHTCYPSIARLSVDTELNRKTIIKAINELEQMGLIKFTGKKRQNGVKIYQLIGVNGRENDTITSPKSGTSTKNGTSPKSGTTPVPKVVLPQSQKRYYPSPTFGTQNHNITIIEPSMNHQKRIFAKKPPKPCPFDPLKIELPEQVDFSLWRDFVEMRKQIKKPLTPRACQIITAKLKNFGQTANAALQNSIVKNWMDVYPPKEPSHAPPNPTQPANTATSDATAYRDKLMAEFNAYYGKSGEPPAGEGSAGNVYDMENPVQNQDETRRLGFANRPDLGSGVGGSWHE